MTNDRINPITMKLAPKMVMPPIFKAIACTKRLINETILEVSGPSNIAMSGIKKKCIGTPNGEGIDSEVTVIVNTLKRAIEIILFSLYFPKDMIYYVTDNIYILFKKSKAWCV